MMKRPRPSDCKELTTEDNDTPITEGQRLYNYYDCQWGRVTKIYDDGWFDFRQEDGKNAYLNGVRVSTASDSKADAEACNRLYCTLIAQRGLTCQEYDAITDAYRAKDLPNLRRLSEGVRTRKAIQGNNSSMVRRGEGY